MDNKFSSYLTNEEKLRAYDEALERARKVYLTGLDENKKSAKYIFPELERYEDEKLKEELIGYFTNGKEYLSLCSFDKRSILDWLGRQVTYNEEKMLTGAKKTVAQTIMDYLDRNSTTGKCLDGVECEDLENAVVGSDWGKVYNYMKEKLELLPCDQCKKEHPSHSCQDITSLGRCALELGAQDEKSKPKFSVGQWVFIEEAEGRRKGPFRIMSVDGNGYHFDPEVYHIVLNLTESVLVPWIIEDSEPGSILAFGNEISIFRDKIIVCPGGVPEFGGFDYYVCYDSNNDRLITDSFYSLTEQDKADVHPATADQCGLLHRKIKEFGFQWDPLNLRIYKKKKK